NLRKLLIPAFIVIILITIAGYFSLRPGRTDIDIQIGMTKQISYETGLELDPNVSPDGKMVALATGPLGRTHLVVRQVVGGRTLEITEDFQWLPLLQCFWLREFECHSLHRNWQTQDCLIDI
ncbi:unnamed protein product, partial [marine sediment metagenome]